MSSRAALTTTFVRRGATLRSSRTITYKRPLMGCALDLTSLTDAVAAGGRALADGIGISTSENALISCGLPSSSSSKSSFVRSPTKLPRSSVTTASMSTKLTSTWNVAEGAGCCCAEPSRDALAKMAGSKAARRRTRALHTAECYYKPLPCRLDQSAIERARARCRPGWRAPHRERRRSDANGTADRARSRTILPSTRRRTHAGVSSSSPTTIARRARRSPRFAGSRPMPLAASAIAWTISAVLLSSASDATPAQQLEFPPAKGFFDHPDQPESRYLWRWVAYQAPDVLLQIRGGDVLSAAALPAGSLAAAMAGGSEMGTVQAIFGSARETDGPALLEHALKESGRRRANRKSTPRFELARRARRSRSRRVLPQSTRRVRSSATFHRWRGPIRFALQTPPKTTRCGRKC